MSRYNARSARQCAMLVVVFAIRCHDLAAQTNERLYENLDFRFETPGARPLGMGKAFVGLADDATAALSNPAGLSNLLEQEFSLEFRGTAYRHLRTVSLSEGDSQNFGDFVFTPSFISYVLPLKRATLSLFRSSIQDYRETFEFGPRNVPRREAPEDGAFGSIAVEADNFGVGGAYVVNRQLSVGGSFHIVSLDLASEARSGSRRNPLNGTNTIESKYRLSGSGGVLWKPVRDVAIGGTYVHKSTFPLKTQLFGTFLFTEFDPDGLIVRTGALVPIDFVIPTRYAGGASWRMDDSLTVVGDVARVLYSQRVTDNFLVVDFLDPGARITSANFFVKDVTELHVGAEYRLYLSRATIALRGGVFTDPNHPLRYRAGGNNPDHPAATLLPFRFNTIPDRIDVGGTVGFGIALADRIQIDAAASFSPAATQFITSFVFRPR